MPRLAVARLVEAGGPTPSEHRHHRQQHNQPHACRHRPLPPQAARCPHAIRRSAARPPGLTLEPGARKRRVNPRIAPGCALCRQRFPAAYVRFGRSASWAQHTGGEPGMFSHTRSWSRRMRKYWPLLPVAATLLAGAAAAVPAQAAASQHPYRLVNPGTFGGPQSYLDLPAVPLTSNGALLGSAETATHDADYPKCNPFMVGFPDRYLTHAFAWSGGRLHDLGALPGNNSSAVFEVNGSGVGVGMSETAITDPYTGWPADHAVMFTGGKVIDLGTLPGGYESQANDINDRGQVSGFASNGTRDKYSFFKVFGGPGPCGPSGWGSQARSFVWRNGVMRDIGTLGGPDAVSTTQNATGQITGQSWTNSAPNPATGIPTLDPFLWANGHMRDLGTLGGTIGFANWLNNRGEVVGVSDLAGDQRAHPFLWADGQMRDLGTLGGDFGFANSVSDQGAVVGGAQAADQDFHGFLWR